MKTDKGTRCFQKQLRSSHRSLDLLTHSSSSHIVERRGMDSFHSERAMVYARFVSERTLQIFQVDLVPCSSMTSFTSESAETCCCWMTVMTTSPSDLPASVKRLHLATLSFACNARRRSLTHRFGRPRRRSHSDLVYGG